jgi:SAM-dependent methyltransferase
MIKYFLYTRSKRMSRQKIYEFISTHLFDIQAHSLVLNVGSGGDVEKTVRTVQRQNNFSVMSLDVSAERYPDVVADICTYEPDQKLDCIVLAEVLEHIPEPHQAINNINEMLNEGGKLILTTPFLYPLHDRPHDYFRYTKFGLAYLLRDFEDVQIIERSGWAETIAVIQARLLREKTNARFARLLLGAVAIITYPLATFLSRLTATDYAPSGYLVVCRKGRGVA